MTTKKVKVRMTHAQLKDVYCRPYHSDESTIDFYAEAVELVLEKICIGCWGIGYLNSIKVLANAKVVTAMKEN